MANHANVNTTMLAVMTVCDSSTLPEQIHSVLVQQGPKPGNQWQHQQAISFLVYQPETSKVECVAGGLSGRCWHINSCFAHALTSLPLPPLLLVMPPAGPPAFCMTCLSLRLLTERESPLCRVVWTDRNVLAEGVLSH